MSSSGLNLESYLIPLDEIIRATGNFSEERFIGDYGFGHVYKGQLSELWQNRTAAVKRIDEDSYQGEREFRKELEIIYQLQHENIISFIGYCDEEEEMIIVYEYALNGSVDHYLRYPSEMSGITWTQRLEICLGAAKGLDYLHSGLGEHKRVIHRNVSAGNILLDGNMVAKISGFGLSVLVDPNNQPQAYDNVRPNQPQAYDLFADPDSYIDPLFLQSGTINTELDVYSFGVVLFEMLSGMLVYHEKRAGDDDPPQSLITLVRRYYDEGLYNLIDHNIRDQVNMLSFNVFKEIAYQCLRWNLEDRPKMDLIIQRIQEALDVQNHRSSSTVARSSIEFENRESFLIPLEEISLATRDFSPETYLGENGFGKVHRGQLSKQWQNRIAAFKRLNQEAYLREHMFITELKVMSNSNHENINPFIGYCDQGNEMIIISEYASNGSLDYHLKDPKKSCCLTWEQRMKICLGAARGLDYLHSGLGENRSVIHRVFKSASILLDDNLDTKICSFGCSLLVDQNQPRVYDQIVADHFYTDPIYKESGMVGTGTDVYSFGIVLFEMLSGMLAYYKRHIDDNDPQILLNLVQRYYDDGLEKLIDPYIRDQINIHSLYTFKKIAYRCISLNLHNRPTMKRIIKRIEEAFHFQSNGPISRITTRSRESYFIPLQEINLATGNLNRETFIGSGGFGHVYKGKLSQRWQNCTVAIKCLDREGHQGKKEFDTEINLISRFHHPNIIPFVGYCDEQDQMILVYQYAVNGSLDQYLASRNKMCSLTWTQRLKICLGAAKGLDYLHSGLGKHQRVIHRDVKSANILLDENLEAKICDFGLSTEGPRNQERSQIFTKVAGTEFYMDPIYHGSGILRKESDIYSLGVVFFEMLSGRLAYRLTKFVDDNPQHLINLVRRYYENGPEKLIDPDIKDHIDSRSFHAFKEIAYQSISFISKERPTMDTIIDKIEDAIDFQASAII